jgi:integrase
VSPRERTEKSYFCVGVTAAGAACKRRVATEAGQCGRPHPITMFDVAEIATEAVIAHCHTADVETVGRPEMVIKGTGFHEDGTVDVFGVTAIEQAILAEGDLHPDRLERVKVVRDLLAAGHAETTHKAYVGNVEQFRTFCRENGHKEFPASVATVGDWIGALAMWRNEHTGRPYQTSTIAAKVSAVSTWHTSNGKPNPVTVEVLTLIRKGFARTLGRDPDPAIALLMEGLIAMVEAVTAPSHAARRTNALMLLLCDPSVGLGPRALERFRTWEQVTWPAADDLPALLELPYGNGPRFFEVHRHADPTLCPVAALQRLYEATEHVGPPFPNIKDGRPMTAGGIVRLAREVCERALVFPDRSYWLDDEERARLVEAALAPTDLQIRDVLLLVLDWWSGTRRSEVAALCWRDLTMPSPASDKLKVVIGRSKSDQTAKGKTRYIFRQPDRRVDPSALLEDWKPRLERLIGRPVRPEDPVLVRLDRAGRLNGGSPKPMSGDAVNERVKAIAAAAGIPGKITSHSLRAGMITNQILRKKSILAISEHVGHASLATTQMYVRAAAGLGDLNPTKPDDDGDKKG